MSGASTKFPIIIQSGDRAGELADANTVRFWNFCRRLHGSVYNSEDIDVSELESVIKDWRDLDPKPDVNAAPVDDACLDKGINIFWYACDLAYKNQPALLDALIDNWDSLEPKPDVNAMPTHDHSKHKGKSIFWCACRLIAVGQPALLNHLTGKWASLEPKPNVNAMPSHDGHRAEGQSVFWSACYFAYTGKPALLNRLLESWGSLNPKPDISKMPVHDESRNKGASVFWYACHLAVMDQPALLNHFIENWGSLDPKPDVNAMPVHDGHRSKGVSVFWYACHFAAMGQPTLLNCLLESWDSLDPKPDVNAMPVHDRDRSKGVSVFWYACHLAATDQPALLNHFIENWGSLDPKPDVNARPVSDAFVDKGVSAFWYACHLAATDKPELLNHFIENWGSLYPKPDISMFPLDHEHPSKGRTVLDQILNLPPECKLPLLEHLSKDWSYFEPCIGHIHSKSNDLMLHPIESLALLLSKFDASPEEGREPIFEKIKQELEGYKADELKIYQAAAFQLAFSFLRNVNMPWALECITCYPVEAYAKVPHFAMELMQYYDNVDEFDNARYYAIAGYVSAKDDSCAHQFLGWVIRLSYAYAKLPSGINFELFIQKTKLDKEIEGQWRVLSGLDRIFDKISRLERMIDEHIRRSLFDFLGGLSCRGSSAVAFAVATVGGNPEHPSTQVDPTVSSVPVTGASAESMSRADALIQLGKVS